MSATIDPGELFERFLREQATAHVEGLGTTLPEGLATPFEDSPLRPLDAKAAWLDAVAVAAWFPRVEAPAQWPVPPEWGGLLVALEPAADVPLSLGQFPQRVRSLALLLRRRPTPTAPAGDGTDLVAWAGTVTKPLPRLLAAGVLRLAGHLDAAADLLAKPVPAALTALRDNELAALAWQRGDHAAALAAWRELADSAAVQFNRGMAYLFLGERDGARTALDAACAALPESSAWHHLASVYRALVELE